MSLEILRLATRQLTRTHTHRAELFLIEEVGQVIKQVEMPVFISPLQKRTARRKAWALQNKPRVLETNRAYHLRNIEKRRKACRDYRKTEKGRAKTKAWYDANTEKWAKYRAEYCAKYPEKIAETRRKYETNPKNIARRNARNSERYHAMTPQQKTEYNREKYEKKKARMLITRRQLALKIGVSETTIHKRLKKAGIKPVKADPAVAQWLDIGIGTRNTQHYYNINQAMKAVQK